MANEAGAIILEISDNLSPAKGTVLDFPVPFANGIVLMSCEYASLGGNIMYYGDEMSFNTWEILHLPIGTRTDSDVIWTLHDGYSYIYYYSQAKFKIYDTTGQEIYSRNNIASIADLHIDFTVHKSHQFIVKIEQDANTTSFLLPAKAVKKLYGESPIFGILDGTVGDNLVKYHGEFIWNYHIFESSGLFNSHESYKTYVRHRINTIKKLAPIFGTNSVGFPTVKNTNSVYSIDGYNYYSKFTDSAGNVIDDTKIITPDVVIRKYNIKFVLSSMLCSEISVSVVPKYQKIVRPGESNNNRPVYEPWLIWGVLKFLWLHRSEEDDDYEIPVFDLSPNWSY